MSLTATEIASQPLVWRRGRGPGAGRGRILPRAGEDASPRSAAAPPGSSRRPTRRGARDRSRVRGTDAFTPSETAGRAQHDRAVIISRSGTTTEDRPPRGGCGEVAADDRDHGGRRLAVRAEVADGRRARLRRRALGGPDAFRDTALALLRATSVRTSRPRSPTRSERSPLPLPVRSGGFDHFVFLGHGWTVGLANEGRSRCARPARRTPRATRRWSTATARSASPGRPRWSGSSGRPTRRSPTTSRRHRRDGADGQLDPMAELVCIHRTAVALAEAHGLDPDRPRHLTRSVVLQEEGTA